MKKLAGTILFLILLNSLFAQNKLEEFDISYGPYSVGFSHYTSFDSSRVYSRIFDYSNKKIPRPIPISIWYPSNQEVKGLTALTVKDYVKILAEEQEWEYLPDYHLLNWFQEIQNTSQNEKQLQEKSNAYFDLKQLDGNFPTVIYSPSYQASSIENFTLCELLASHGYIVISSPSRGADSRFLEGGTVKDLETQARDIQFLIEKATQIPGVDPDKIASMGFSFGGMSNVLSQMRDSRIKALISLDGTVKYAYQTLQASPSFNIENVNVPFIHMAQKDIPKEVLEADNIEASLNSEFTFFDELEQNDAFQLKFLHLTHSYFSTLGILFGTRDPRQDHADSLIAESYKIVTSYTLNFLNAYLLGNEKALDFMKVTPENNGIKDGFLTIKKKQSIENRSFDFSDFNDLNSNNGYTNLNENYDSLKVVYPELELPEGNLNTLGLQLLYNKETTEKSIRIFEFATRLYPNSANLFDSLGEAYLFHGDIEKAKINYQKSLELNPQNESAASVLKRLEKTNK